MLNALSEASYRLVHARPIATCLVKIFLCEENNVLSDYHDDPSCKDAFFNGRYNIHLFPVYRPQLAEEYKHTCYGLCISVLTRIYRPKGTNNI